jgi:hypothetical protein
MLGQVFTLGELFAANFSKAELATARFAAARDESTVLCKRLNAALAAVGIVAFDACPTRDGAAELALVALADLRKLVALVEAGSGDGLRRVPT